MSATRPEFLYDTIILIATSETGNPQQCAVLGISLSINAECGKSFGCMLNPYYKRSDVSCSADCLDLEMDNWTLPAYKPTFAFVKQTKYSKKNVVNTVGYAT